MRVREDSELVSAVAAGDSTAYGELYERYESKLYNYAYRIAGNPEDARDIAQDAFVKVYEALPRIAERGAEFAPYLYRTAHNVAIDSVRTRGRYGGDEAALELSAEDSVYADPERVTLLAEQQALVRAATTGLSESHREILALRELQGLSYTDIGEILGMQRTTVGVTLMRARLKLKGAVRMSYVDVDKLAKECADMLPLLSAYIDGEVTAEERERVAAHLDECPLCRLALEEMTEASQSYRAIIPLIPPFALREGVLSRLAQLHPAGPSSLGGGQGGASGPGAEAPGGPAPTQVLPQVEGGYGYGGGAAGTYGYGGGSDAAAATADGGRLTSWIGSLPTGAKVALVCVAVVLGLLLGGSAGVLALGGIKRPATLQAPVVTPSTFVTPTAEASATEPTTPTGSGQGEVKAEPQPENSKEQQLEGDKTPPPAPDQVSPEDGWASQDPDVTLSWTSVDDPSGVTYTLEIQTFLGGGAGWGELDTATDLHDTSYGHTVGDMTERWRVWAVDGAGNASERTSWRSLKKLVSTEPPPTEPPIEPTSTPPVDKPPTIY